jgi:methylenetetrahydrofolate dehydrogenase (NADP+)/methenyltetrahydrofolate cyclohydrolase
MIKVDGKEIAEDITAELKKERGSIDLPIQLAALLVGEDPASIHYLKQKEKVAGRVGVYFELHRLSGGASTEEVKEKVFALSRDRRNTGVIIQLPLPPQIETQVILDAVPAEKDVDMLSEKSVGAFFDGHAAGLPPVVGAIEAILQRFKIDPAKKFVVVVGAGRLVGVPAMIWFSRRGATVCLLHRDAENISRFTAEADILLAGSGNPQSITGKMVKEGVVVLDAGYEVVDGKAVGDVDFESVAPKAALITPVPGGIGPITVTMLMKNLLSLSKAQFLQSH